MSAPASAACDGLGRVESVLIVTGASICDVADHARLPDRTVAIDVVPALSITEAVPAATTESSASGGAVRKILDVRTDPTLGSGDMAGSFVCRPAPDLPTISVGKITAFRLCCKAGFQPDVQATVRPPERSSRTNLWREHIRERSAGAERTGRKQMLKRSCAG